MSTASRAILCVDDEKIVLDSLKAQLRREFGRDLLLEFAESAGEALEVADELHASGARLEVVISDWLMPGMKGDELLLTLNDRFPDATKILLTGQADSVALEKLPEVMKQYRELRKPWEEEELLGVVQSALAG